MKKIFYILMFLICTFIKVKVFAESFICEYNFESKKDKISETFVLEYDITNGYIINHSEKEDTTDWLGNSTIYGYNYNFLDGEIKLYKKNVCPILFMTNSVRAPHSNDVSQGALNIPTNQKTNIIYYFFSDSYARDAGGPECVTERDDFCLENLFSGEFNSYYTGTLTDSETNKNNIEASICPTFDLAYSKIEEEYKKTATCEESCLENIIVANEYIDSMRQTCNSILAHRDYFIYDKKDGSIISSDACVVSCLDLSKLVNDLKNKYGIDVDIEGQCGFSGKLIQFIANIVKWLKYIIPVIVIVLGILDFIQAISTDKDDEMKKAQGRFVKRLIAAALIFIIPFIIEFVLDKMGFDANGCGIIDL